MTADTYDQQCDIAENHMKNGDLESAIQSAHHACSAAPTKIRAYQLIAAALLLKGDFLSALETYELSWLLNPDDLVTNEGIEKTLRILRGAAQDTQPKRPLMELSKFGYYSKACRRFLRINQFAAAGRAGDLAKGETSDVLLQTAIMNIDATLCNWSRHDEHLQYFYDYAFTDKPVAQTSPLFALCLKDDPLLHLAVAQKFLQDRGGHQAVVTRKLRPTGKSKHRPRIGYLSADFHDHATSRLMVGMLEAHNAGEWDIVGVSYGPDDQSPMRARMEKAFGSFVDLHNKPVQANLQTLRALKLDILVDTKGLTNGFEPAYSLSRPAPVVVNFLAYPGSMGSSAYDYVIGDGVVTPFEHQPHFSECLVQMPHTYQPNDPHRPTPAEAPTRTQVGLPENAFVLAAFNQTKKITPSMFQTWMHILLALPEAVLWLYSTDAIIENNLRSSAAQWGVQGNRLIFAPNVPQEQHLARHHLADLFLDTFPYNAHTTASDALWMGLPVVTLKGVSFASRVAASLLETIGLPQLVAQSPEDYANLVLRLAAHRSELHSLKQHLIAARQSSALFDPKSYASNLEQAYTFMIERSRKGKPPHSFEVRAISDGGGVRLAGGREFKPQKPLLG